MAGPKEKFKDVFGCFVVEPVWLSLLRFLSSAERDCVEVVGCFVVVEPVWLFLLRFLSSAEGDFEELPLSGWGNSEWE